jgi:hypothetical protein
VPDDPEAREAAERVAEIDALVLADRRPEATRRYREVTGTSWDDALAALRGWHDLERTNKLALCGWCPKEPYRIDKLEEPSHPMLDPWIDGPASAPRSASR